MMRHCSSVVRLCLLSMWLGLALAHNTEEGCIRDSECCDAGGWCGDGVFDECEDGDWDYSTKCDPTYKVCCMPHEPVTSAPSTTTLPYTGPTTEAPTRPTVAPGSCGQRPPPPSDELTPPSDDYIVGGVEAVPNSWPWAVSIELDYFGWGAWEHYCGASLLNEQWIVTAAHCIAKSGVKDPGLYRAVLRMHDKHDKDDDVLTMYISKMITHEDYSTEVDGSPNDIALMKFTEAVVMDDKMSPVCLPLHRDDDFVHHECYITGWGLTKGTANEDVLNEALIDVITNEVCDQKWEDGSGRVGLIKDSHICVGNGGPQGPGSCNGDSGGPLQCFVNGTNGIDESYWTLAGVTSFGASGCVAEDAPAVYTRISYFLDWIHTTVANN